MNTLITLFAKLLITTMCVWGDAPKSITLGFTPGEDPEWLRKNGVELGKYLQEKIGVPVDIYVSKNYRGLIQAMKDKKVDFAFFTARTFVEAEKEAGAKVILKKVWNAPYYYSSIVTLQKSKITNLKQLQGKSFGYVDKGSTSGYLYPRVAIKKAGFDPEKFFSKVEFFGQHEATIKALFDGKADAVAVYSDHPKGKTGAWTRYFEKEASKVRVLWVSDPIPNDPLCVRNDFHDKYPRLVYDLMFALIDLRDEPAEKNLLKKLFGISYVEFATSRQYDPVRELVKYLGVEE